MQKEQKPRLLARTLAKELSPEELDAVRGTGSAIQRPPISTLAATLPDYNEDQ